MGGEGAVEFLEFEFDDFRDLRAIEVIVRCVVGDVPESVEDGTNVWMRWMLPGLAEPHTSML